MDERKVRVLVAEDGPGEVAGALRAIQPEPGSRLELTSVSTIPTLLATIDLALPEALFLDLSLARPHVLDAVRRVHRAAPGIPLIVCADATEKDDATRSLIEGAVDYVLKGYMDARTMERVLRTALERNTLAGLADLLRDEFTGFYNREGVMTLGTRALETARRTGGTLVLLCARIENLDALHQDLGPAGSEETIRETTGILRSCFRRTDLLGRLGRGEFCALAVDAAEPSAPILLQRVRSRLSIVNGDRQAWAVLRLCLSVGYWGGSDSRSLAEFLDAVESGLRGNDESPARKLAEPEAGPGEACCGNCPEQAERLESRRRRERSF